MTASLRCENRSSFPSAALAALVLGLVLCPFIYLALYSAYEPFFFATLPPLLVSSGYLLFRFFGKPEECALSGVWWLIAEILSWLVIAWFTNIFFSNIPPLSTTFERINVFFMFFLLASLFSLPVVLMRKTALQQRLMKLPNSVITPLFMWVVSVSTAVVVIDLLTPNSAGW